MASVLVVDDTAVERHRTGVILGKRLGPTDTEPVQVTYAANGREALELMGQDRPDLVITDLMMPEVNGLELVKQVRATYPSVPVILITAHGSEEIAAEALKIGAAGYVPKKHLARQLRSTVEDTLRLTQTARDQQLIFEHLTESESRFLLHNDLALVAPLVGYLNNNLKRIGLCHEADELRVTVALREALINALAHGNLEVPSSLKETDDTAYRRLLAERRRQPPYRDRRLHVHARETPTEVVYVVRDEGPGFDPERLPDPTDPANLEKTSGRGLFLIRTFMDEVRFNLVGNEITMIKRRGGV